MIIYLYLCREQQRLARSVLVVSNDMLVNEDTWTYIVIETSFFNHRDEDVVCLPNNLDSFRGNLSKYPNGNTWSWERVTHYKIFMDAKLAAEGSNFVFEELNLYVS